MAHDMYLTFDEYKGLGGTVDAAAWPPLECACRKRIDRLTDSRVQNMAEIPMAVKLCVFALAQMESAGHIAHGYIVQHGWLHRKPRECAGCRCRSQADERHRGGYAVR